MPKLSELQQAAASARNVRDAARAKLRENALRLQTVEQKLKSARREAGPNREGPHTVAELEREQSDLRESLPEAQRQLSSSRERAIRDIGQRFLDPQNLVEQLDDTLPFLLFPVRIETKFSVGQEGNVLKVRIFPDDISIAHHEKELTVGEKDAGENYWRSRAGGNAEKDADEKERSQRGAWNLIASRYGSYRASWITRSTQPADWSDKLTDPLSLKFPDLVTKPLAWSDAPRSPVMPDVFAVILERGSASRTVLGRMVPDDLPLGPDPLQAEGFLTRDPVSGRLKISDDLNWLIDFDKAEAVGMGVRISLTQEEAANGFSRILVLGLRLSTEAAGSTALLSRLIESHRYSQGISILRQGTPTNNTSETQSGLTTADESVDETYALEHDPSPFPISGEPMQQSDGQRLANALGLSYDLVRALPNARSMDIAESVAMNRALWSATLGNFNREMLQGTFAPSDVSSVRLFLNEFVHGRGLIPAIRVGSEPYGIVVTSSFDDWEWSDFERGQDGSFWDRLLAQLGLLRKDWIKSSLQVRFVGNRDVHGNPLDPFETLLNIIGLQASSVEYWSRTGVPDSYITALAAYRGNDPDLVNNWVANAKNTRILDLVNAHLRVGSDARLKSVLFLDEADRVTPPVVDGDPAIPLSETELIRPYNGISGNNYLYWLATASTSDLQAERFVGADGKLVNAPPALLYKMLRVSALAELYTASRGLAERIRPDLFVGAPELGDTPNIQQQVLMPGHYAAIDAGKIGVAAQSMATGDYLLGHARASTAVIQKPPEAAPLAALTDALRVLANVPTARLERLLAEHVDIVSYRLDAWLTAAFARRLAIQRIHRRAASGTYIGAYGWVEDVSPATDRQFVATTAIPEELRSSVDGRVVSYANNGGFVQAPSLPHAVTAAVLRNAYLTHTEPSRADRMSVNLSSARVRTALRYVEGLKNGQELGALLGYQLERGLHEGHPGVELDQFIYVLRERFPLISKKLTPTQDGVSAEVIEARNVVNGYDLLDATKNKTYPYDIAGLPRISGTPAESSQATAISKEIDALRDAMDAVADLLLSESVHQVVQGNYARARGAIQALTDGELAPLPDVVQTPRSGKSLTHRVAVVFDPAATGGWSTTLTPRANASAMVNHWLRSVLPAPSEIEYRVQLGTGPAEFINLTPLGLEPIDVVTMCGERVGDLSGNLEQLLVRDFRSVRKVADDVATFFFRKTDAALPDARALVFDPDQAGPGKYSLGSLMPLLKALRRITSVCRPLGARDLMLPSEAQKAHPENPNGYDGVAPSLKDLGELKGRIEIAHAGLSSEEVGLQALITAMQPLADALTKDDKLPVQPGWNTLLPQLRTRLRNILLHDVPEAMPFEGAALTRTLVAATFSQAEAVQAIVEQKLARARTLLDIAFLDPLPSDATEAARETGRRGAARLEAYSEAARTLLGASFVAVPLFAAHSESVPEIKSAAAVPVEGDPLAIESWLQSLSHVRPGMQSLGTVATYHEWLFGGLLPFVPIQLPLAAGARWIGTAYGDSVKADDVVSLVVHTAPGNFSLPIAGLLLDEWTELVPAENETTGIALNVNRPNAVAPQALLLAISPKQVGQWTWSRLIAVLRDTLDRARLRAVEPDLIKYPYFQLLPPIVTAFNRFLLMPAATLTPDTRISRSG